MLFWLQLLLQNDKSLEAVVSEGAQVLAFNVHLAPLFLVKVPLQMSRVFGFWQKQGAVAALDSLDGLLLFLRGGGDRIRNFGCHRDQSRSHQLLKQLTDVDRCLDL